MDFLNWMSVIQQRMERVLDAVLPSAVHHCPTRLHDAMRYAVLGGGKRIRPLLCHASGSIFAASENVLDNAAAAVELIHIYSLVHDDLPCMDDDVLRRGKPTCHVAFDEATALLVGDALQALAFQVLTSKIDQFDAIQQLSMLRTLAIAAGTSGMVGGQALDIAAVGKLLTIAELELMHLQKTGALIRAAVLLGAFAGNASAAEIDLLTHFANRSGLLFQVVDDILDVDGDTNTLGKTAGKDAFQEKPTYVSLLGLAQAKELARDLLQEAHESLAPFGERATRLHELADFIVNRKF